MRLVRHLVAVVHQVLCVDGLPERCWIVQLPSLMRSTLAVAWKMPSAPVMCGHEAMFVLHNYH